MELTNLSCEAFLAELAGNAPAPGGGGAAALVGAAGAALGNMVGSLTVGKKKYAAVEADILALNERSAALRKRLEGLVQADAEAFLPLSPSTSTPPPTWKSALPTPATTASARGAAGRANAAATRPQPSAARPAFLSKRSARMPRGICSAKAQ